MKAHPAPPMAQAPMPSGVMFRSLLPSFLVCMFIQNSRLFLVCPHADAWRFPRRECVIALWAEVVMSEVRQTPKINSAKIPVSGNIIGAIVAVGCMAIFL